MSHSKFCSHFEFFVQIKFASKIVPAKISCYKCVSECKQTFLKLIIKRNFKRIMQNIWKTIKRVSTLCQRNIHLSRITLSNVKIEMNIADTTKVLNVINNTDLNELTQRFEITNVRARKLKTLREKLGYIENIDQLLDIDGFGWEIINKFCNSILNEDELKDHRSKEKKRNFSFIYPSFPSHVLEEIDSFTSIYIGPTALTWATYNLESLNKINLTHWRCVQIMPETKRHIHDLISFLGRILEDVPDSSLYVFESPRPLVFGSKNSISDIRISQMIGMAGIFLERRYAINCTDDDLISNIAFIRNFLFVRLFQLKVGCERISTLDVVTRLLTTQEMLMTDVSVDTSLQAVYNKSSDATKEYLGCSFLLGLAFFRLSVLKCPNSIAIVMKRK